jgi:plastocyanin
MTRITAVLAAAAVGALMFAAPAAPALPRLVGTVGPGFTITLKKGGRKVTRLRAGRYAFVVTDRSGIHNFHVRGPGVNKVITGLGFTGRKTVTLKLRPGRYTYVCDPHKPSMRGSFRVT